MSRRQYATAKTYNPVISKNQELDRKRLRMRERLEKKEPEKIFIEGEEYRRKDDEEEKEGRIYT